METPDLSGKAGTVRPVSQGRVRANQQLAGTAGEQAVLASRRTRPTSPTEGDHTTDSRRTSDTDRQPRGLARITPSPKATPGEGMAKPADPPGQTARRAAE